MSIHFDLNGDDSLGWIYLTPVPGPGDAHVIPENDIKGHDVSEDCWCHPVDDHEAPDYVWHHNAKDGREAYQNDGRKLN